MRGNVPPTLPSPWAVLQLREGLDPAMPVSALEHEFHARWPDAVLKFPAVKRGQLDPDNPLSAYVLIAPPVPPRAERLRLVAAVLCDPATRQPYLVSEEELRAMTPLPAFPPLGTSVLVTAGDFSGLEGTIVEVNCTTAKVLIELWSRRSILTLAANELQRL